MQPIEAAFFFATKIPNDLRMSAKSSTFVHD